MREVKFKCWLVGSKKMLVLESTTEAHNHYLQTGSGGFWLYDSTEGKLMASSEAGDVLLQFTGQHDSEDKEVYEDDLINAGYGVGRVIFQEGCFFIEWIDYKEANIEPLAWVKNNRPRTGYIVIGNVHESPELLTTNIK